MMQKSSAGTYAVFAPREHGVRMMFAVTLLHLALLGAVLHPLMDGSTPPPVLSFMVTMMDVSSSRHSIASAASSASAPATKATLQKAVAEVTPDHRGAKIKKTAKPTTVATAKTAAPLAHDAEAQTAVLAPTTPAQYDAAYLNNPPPAYPALSRRLGEQGNILLSVYVNESGQPQTVQLKKSSGFDRLDNAALAAVKRWRFASARQGDQFIASWVQVPVHFILE